MRHSRTIFRTLLAAAGFALAIIPASVDARQPGKDELPKRPASYSRVSAFKEMESIPADQLKNAKDAFAAFAKYQAEYISSPRVYSTPQEFVPSLTRTGELVRTTDEVIAELHRHILIPLPGSKVGPDRADYIRELGVALDAALKEVIETTGEPVVRVNAMRLLAEACRSGATAHYPTITGLIANANTRPEVKYYAFQAAGNLLAAYDLNDYQSRKHSNKPKEVSDLIAALQDAVLKPAAILPIPAGTKLPPDQTDVLTFIRRQAVRALGHVRFAEYKVTPGGPDLYPGFTLAQVAVSDPAISPPPTETEAAEAVIGICNMTPPMKKPEREAYAHAMTDAVATGIITFANRRAANPTDKSHPWRGYAARLTEALKAWRPLFDPGFNPAKPTAFLPAEVPQLVMDTVAEAEKRVLGPMDGATGIDLNGFRQFRDNTLRGNKKWTPSPFLTNPKLTLPKKN